MPRLAMVIDLRKCIGCETCKHVCAEMHANPTGGTRRRIINADIQSASGAERIFVPVHCMHCEKPSCLAVCPTGATMKLPDGTVVVESDRCVGCGACVLACPYGARTLSQHDCSHALPKTEAAQDDASRGEMIGTCAKCDFCRFTIGADASEGVRPGSGPESSPLCVRYCIAEALNFGDLEDSTSEVSRLLRNHRVFRLCENFGTQPSVYYISDELTE